MTRQILPVSIRFVVVGAFSTLINYLFFLFMLKLNINYIVSSASGYIVGVFVGFLLNNFWTFKFGRFEFRVAAGYILVYMFSLGLSSLFLWTLVHILHANVLISNVFTIGLSTVSNFLGLNYFIYNTNEPK